MSSNKLEENQSISLTCNADVGSPQGYVQILKIPEYSNTPEVIYTSNTTNIRTENCTEYINVTTTYTVTREDNGAVFRCSSQNGLTQGLGPNRTSSKITVICMYKCYLTKEKHFKIEIEENMLKTMFIIVCCRKKTLGISERFKILSHNISWKTDLKLFLLKQCIKNSNNVL